MHGSINWPLKFARYMESQEIVSISSSANRGYPTFWNWILVYENVCLRMAQNAFINGSLTCRNAYICELLTCVCVLWEKEGSGKEKGGGGRGPEGSTCMV